MLFNRKSESRGETAPAPRPAAPIAPEQPPAAAGQGRHGGAGYAPTQSFIDASLTIVGDLHSEGDVRIDGRICGTVSCAQLIVGTDAAITGAVKAEQAIVRGSITGPIRAPVVILQETARVQSDIAYTVLAIDDGATFEGAVHRSENPLDETETSSRLVDLQRVIAVEGSSAAATPCNGRDPASDQDLDKGPPKPERRNANGHADAQR
jgi:cytoskeletal protein CcmA (bactofilin family)